MPNSLASVVLFSLPSVIWAGSALSNRSSFSLEVQSDQPRRVFSPSSCTLMSKYDTLNWTPCQGVRRIEAVECTEVSENTPSGDVSVRLRLARLRQHPPVTQKEAALLVGVTRPMYSYYETGKYPVPERVLRILAEKWNARELVSDMITIEPLPQTGLVPDLGELSAGRFQMNDGDPSFSPVPIEYAVEGNAVATIRSDSMFPTLHDRDRVAVRMTNSPPIGSIVVAMSEEGEVIVKRLMYRNGERILVGDNPDHPPTDPKKCQLIAEVLAIVGRSLR